MAIKLQFSRKSGFYAGSILRVGPKKKGAVKKQPKKKTDYKLT